MITLIGLGILLLFLTWPLTAIHAMRQPAWAWEAIGRSRIGWLIGLVLVGPRFWLPYWVRVAPQLRRARVEQHARHPAPLPGIGSTSQSPVSPRRPLDPPTQGPHVIS